MRLRAVRFDDDENPSEFDITLTLDEAALLYRRVGHIAPKAVTEATGDVRWGNALYDVADGLGALFNPFYDDGVNEVLRRFSLESERDTQ